MNLSTLRRMFLTMFLTIVAMAPLAARAADFSDMWWAAGGVESGWGVNLTQNENIIFATFYIFDANRKPIWYTAAMTDTGTGATFAGPLYQSTGTFFGSTWNPADNSASLVGSATFTPSASLTTNATTGTLSYTVANPPGAPVVVNKAIQRFAFMGIVLGGNYSGILSVTDTSCPNSSNNGSALYDIDPQVTQTTDGSLQLLVNYTQGGSCTLMGQSVQLGQLFTIPSASFTCTFGANTTATVYEVKATNLGIEGRWYAPNVSGCQEFASFSALLQ